MHGLLRGRDSERGPSVGREPKASREVARDRAIRCAHCGHVVTSTRHRLEVGGRHEHTCVNPESTVFVVCCFREAPGVHPRGELVSHFSWFAGYAWQIVACRSCHAQLGWRYVGEGRPFLGLIADRLAER